MLSVSESNEVLVKSAKATSRTNHGYAGSAHAQPAEANEQQVEVSEEKQEAEVKEEVLVKQETSLINAIADECVQ